MSSARREGRKESIFSQVKAHSFVYPSGVWKTPAVSITSNKFFKLSGMASINSSLCSEWCMYLSKYSRIWSQSELNSSSCKSGVRCCRKTLQSNVAARMRVSSIPDASDGLSGSNNLNMSGNNTCIVKKKMETWYMGVSSLIIHKSLDRKSYLVKTRQPLDWS